MQVGTCASTMAGLFDALKRLKRWDRVTSSKAIERGRVLFALADLRPEEVLCVRMYTVRFGAPAATSP